MIGRGIICFDGAFKLNTLSDFIRTADESEKRRVFEQVIDESVEMQNGLKIPARDLNAVAEAKSNSLTIEDAFGKMFERYKDALEEISKK